MEKVLTPLQAIRKKCLDCTGDNLEEIRKCPIEECPLYIYRSGKLEQDKEKTKERMAKARANRKLKE